MHGVTAYEGLIQGSDLDDRIGRVRRFAADVRAFAQAIGSSKLFDVTTPIVSAGGSSFYDIVLDELHPTMLGFPAELVLRAGCYVTHDHGLYAFTGPPRKRAHEADGPQLVPALELLASVLSCPEPDLAIVGF